MKKFIVRGANWEVEIELPEDILGNNDFLFYEAATQAIETLFKQMKDPEFDSTEKPSIGSTIQVAIFGYDIKNIFEPDVRDKFIEYMQGGFLKILPSPLVLANAGKYTQADFLKNLIENDK